MYNSDEIIFEKLSFTNFIKTTQIKVVKVCPSSLRSMERIARIMNLGHFIADIFRPIRLLTIRHRPFRYVPFRYQIIRHYQKSQTYIPTIYSPSNLIFLFRYNSVAVNYGYTVLMRFILVQRLLKSTSEKSFDRFAIALPICRDGTKNVAYSSYTWIIFFCLLKKKVKNWIASSNICIPI